MGRDRFHVDHKPRTQLLLRFGYDGSGFRGVMAQPGLPTVGATLRARVEAAFGREVNRLVAAARTDTGVHAVENLATCWFPVELDPAEGLARLAQARPDGLHRVEGRVVPMEVFARAISTGKHYRYRLEDGWDVAEIDRIRIHDLARKVDPEGVARAPALEGRAWQVAPRLHLEPMQEAAAHLVGTHDFSAFKVGRLGDKDPVRTLHRLDIRREERAGHGHFVFDVEGPGFLYKMVRILVGTLAEVGAGLRAPADMPALLASRSRQATGQSALARGLCLVRVHTATAFFDEPWEEPAFPGLGLSG